MVRLKDVVVYGVGKVCGGFNSKNGAIKSATVIRSTTSQFVSIPKMVRLKDKTSALFFRILKVSIPKMVRLKEPGRYSKAF